MRRLLFASIVALCAALLSPAFASIDAGQGFVSSEFVFNPINASEPGQCVSCHGAQEVTARLRRSET